MKTAAKVALHVRVSGNEDFFPIFGKMLELEVLKPKFLNWKGRQQQKLQFSDNEDFFQKISRKMLEFEVLKPKLLN